ncbi:MAG: hypothetical protein V1725_07070 [archaeon]
MAIVYGIDTEKRVTPVMVRDAIITCFTQAHADVLEQLKDVQNFSSKEEFERMKRLDVKMLVQQKFLDVHGNFDCPTKNDLEQVCEKLADYAVLFRNPSLVQQHFGEIMQLIVLLEK